MDVAKFNDFIFLTSFCKLSQHINVAELGDEYIPKVFKPIHNDNDSKCLWWPADNNMVSPFPYIELGGWCHPWKTVTYKCAILDINNKGLHSDHFVLHPFSTYVKPFSQWQRLCSAIDNKQAQVPRSQHVYDEVYEMIKVSYIEL